MKKIFFFVAALAATMMAQATVFVDETFADFPGTAWNASGSLVTGTGRTQDTALTYSDGDKSWVLSGKGNSVKTSLDASTSYQHTKSLPANITSDYYVAFMLRADGQQKQLYLQVFGLGSPSLGARVWLGKGQVDATKCRLGVTRSSGTGSDVQWAASEFATDQTMLVVLKYTMTATDTIASIYVNPAIGGTEPATPMALDNSKGVNKCKKSVTNMTFYTNGGNKSYFTVGGARVCTDWAEAVAEATPATVEHTYTITFISPDCDDDDYIIPAITGDFNNWQLQEMSRDDMATAVRSNQGLLGAVYTCTVTAEEGSMYNFHSTAEWGGVNNNLLVWDNGTQDWLAYSSTNFTFGETTELTYDLGDPEAYHWTYCIDTPTAVENTTAEVKAQKTIENGQIVIIRDGKKFNAVGAEL